MYKRFFGSLCLALICTWASAQAPSPFSGIGIGQLNANTMIQNEALGGVGVGMGSYWNLNTVNPALLTYSKGTLFGGLTTFQAGITYDNRSIRNQTDTEPSFGTNLSYITMGFPIVANKWFSSLGIKPFSTVKYRLNYTAPYPGSNYEASITEIGSGGINALHWSNGIQLTKNISVGLRAQFLFSSIYSESTTNLISDDIPVRFASTIFERVTPSGMLLDGGIAYTDSIRIKDNDPLRITVGLTYNFQKDVKTKEYASIERRLLSGTIWELDTLKYGTEGTISIPSGFGIGMSIANGFKWTAGVDVKVNNYSEFRISGNPANTQNTFFIGGGFELTPDAFSIDEYLKRVTYRIGASYEDTPYSINGIGVKDFGINFGFSLPIVPSTNSGAVLNKGLSSVDFGFRYGRQGNVTENLIEEEYYRIHFGVTFNDKWFVKRKFN